MFYENFTSLMSALFLSGGLPEVLQMAEFWSNRQADSRLVGGSEHAAQEPSPNPRHTVQYTPTGSGEMSTQLHTRTHITV